MASSPVRFTAFRRRRIGSKKLPKKKLLIEEAARGIATTLLTSFAHLRPEQAKRQTVT